MNLKENLRNTSIIDEIAAEVELYVALLSSFAIAELLSSLFG